MRRVLALLTLSMVMALVPVAAMADDNGPSVQPQPVVTTPDPGTPLYPGSPVVTPPWQSGG